VMWMFTIREVRSNCCCCCCFASCCCCCCSDADGCESDVLVDVGLIICSSCGCTYGTNLPTLSSICISGRLIAYLHYILTSAGMVYHKMKDFRRGALDLRKVVEKDAGNKVMYYSLFK